MQFGSKKPILRKVTQIDERGRFSHGKRKKIQRLRILVNKNLRLYNKNDNIHRNIHYSGFTGGMFPEKKKENKFEHKYRKNFIINLVMQNEKQHE